VLVGGGSVGSVGFVGRSTAGLLSSPLLLGLAATVLVVVGAFAVVFRHPARDLGSRVVRGFSVVGSPRAFGGVGLWKVTAWTLRIACVFTFLLAFHMPATAWTALVVIGAQSVAGTVPLAPGNAGTQQAALALAFRGMVGAGTVVGFGVGMHSSTSSQAGPPSRSSPAAASFARRFPPHAGGGRPEPPPCDAGVAWVQGDT